MSEHHYKGVTCSLSNAEAEQIVPTRGFEGGPFNGFPKIIRDEQTSRAKFKLILDPESLYRSRIVNIETGEDEIFYVELPDGSSPAGMKLVKPPEPPLTLSSLKEALQKDYLLRQLIRKL